MNKRIEMYLEDLRDELEEADSATLQDALADAEEHLTTALEAELETETDKTDDEIIDALIVEYGTPQETAEAYLLVEEKTVPAMAFSPKRNGNLLTNIFGVFADPKAWGSLFYMLISLVTGVLYFSWVVNGYSLSLSLALFIFGLPLLGFFLSSLRVFGLIEGRIVEGLLGVRMPRRARFAPQDLGWLDKLKFYLTDRTTWMMTIYFLLMLVLGTLYFCVFVTLIALVLSLFVSPIFSMFGIPVVHLGTRHYVLPVEWTPAIWIFDFFLLTGVMHLAKAVGKLQGKFAKFMLVGDW